MLVGRIQQRGRSQKYLLLEKVRVRSLRRQNFPEQKVIGFTLERKAIPPIMVEIKEIMIVDRD